MDYEDFVGGQPCRFGYKTVLPKKFGLKTEQVLTMSDKELNQVSVHPPRVSTCTIGVPPVSSCLPTLRKRFVP